MKRKILILMALVVAIVCMLAISVSAAEPNNEGKTVTLADGTVCALYDTDGNPLIWYVTSTDADTGVKTYAYVQANDPSLVDFNNGWSGGDQLGTLKITVGDQTYEKATFVVLNLYGAKITSGYRIGNEIVQFAATTFENATSLEYAYLPVGTFAFNGQTFKNCSKLTYLNINEMTELKTLGGQLFNGCVKLFAGQKLDMSHTKVTGTGSGVFTGMTITEIILPTTFSSIGEWTFQNCKQLKKITFLGEITSMNVNSTFKECYELEEIVGLDEFFGSESFTSLGNQTFYMCKKLKNVYGLMENGILSFPTTLTFIGAGCFKDCQQIKLIDFNGNNNNVTFDNNSVFRGCTALKAVSLPRNTTHIYNGMFTDCSELEAVYLPSALVALDGNKYGDGCFDDCKKLYFTSQEFDVEAFITDGQYDSAKFEQNKPVKDEVYFFPSNFSIMGDTQNSPTFTYCTNLNPVLVFPETFTGALSGDGDLLNIGTKDSPKKVVFLGNMTSFNAQTQNSRQNYITFYFMNEADKSPADIGYKNGYASADATEGYMFFCHGDNAGYYQILRSSGYSEKKTDKTLHLKNPDATETTFKATCIKDAIETQYCFCGKDIYSGEVENTATGIHIYDDDHDCTTSDKCTADPDCTEVTVILSHELYETLVYESFLAGGKYNYGCSNDGCTAIDIVDKDAKAIFSAGADKGYSTNGDGIAFGGYTINIDALNEYNRVNENNKLNFGIIIVNPNYVGDTFMKDGKTNAEKGFLQVDMSDAEYSNIQIMVNGFVGDSANLSLVFTLYAYTDANDVEFIQSEDTLSASAKVTKTDATLYTVTLDSVKAQAGTAIPELPEYVVPSKEQE